jgi:large subunit ribosomal protein L6
VTVPSGVEVKIKGSEVRVNGPKGELQRIFSPRISIKMEGDQVIVTRSSEDAESRSLHGTTRALIQNMVTGVSAGFMKILEVHGVGYRMEQDGKNVTINVGFSHPVIVEPPEGITFEADMKIRQLRVIGFDKQVVGQVAADIRKIRPPEPYKGKGIRYLGEKVRRKAGKTAKSV